MRIHFPEKHDFWMFGDPPILYPMVPVKLIGHHGRTVSTYALLDSGADCCMFHAKWAKAIGLNLQSGRLDTLFGIDPDAPLNVYYHRINLEIGATKVRCDVAFSEAIGEEMHDQLVGRIIVFDKIRFAFRQSVSALYAGPES